jgi:hypothetical protein
MSLRDYQLKFRQQQRHAADNHHNPFIHNDSIFAYLADDNVPEGWGGGGVEMAFQKSVVNSDQQKISRE